MNASAPSTDEEVPNRVRPYVAALGEAGAIEFLIHFGGQMINIPARRTGKNALTREVGSEMVDTLRAAFGQGKLQVPIPRRWLAQRLAAQGVGRGEIAKRLHVTRESVRQYFASERKAS